MVTSLIAGTAVPSWDAAFVRALNDAIAGFWNEPPAWHYEVTNDEGEADRRLVIDGPAQHSKILACLLERGFLVTSTSRGSLIRRAEDLGSP